MIKLPEIHTAIREHLAKLDVVTDEQINQFLFPKLSDLPSPFLLKSIDEAVDLIIDTMVNKNDILIWGDYDVDGITGTSLLYNFFKEYDVFPKCHIPNRLTDGYGLNKDALMRFSNELSENKLLITVDCGISNHEELLLAKRYGFKTIVTDHHQVPEGDLYADATINPQQPDCSFPFAALAGVGVAFYLICAVRSKIRNNSDLKYFKDINLKSFLGYVAIGTIADIMPLTGVNRVLVKGGVESISESEQHGIKALFDTFEIDSSRFTSESVAYKIAPAINAAGRLGIPEKPLQMFTASSNEGALAAARKLISLNNKRKSITNQNIDLALDISRKELNKGYSSMVLFGDFHEGVLGIIASRLVEEFNVPALVCCSETSDKNRIKGSGRSPEGYDLYGLLNGCASYLDNFGGHELAAGFSLKSENFLHFKQIFNTLTEKQKDIISNDNMGLGNLICKLDISDALNSTLLSNLLLLEPTGEANPKPIFSDNSVRFVSYSLIGKNRNHLKGTIRGRRSNIPVIGFNLGKKTVDLNLTDPCGITFGHSLDHYEGKARWKIQIFDIWQ